MNYIAQQIYDRSPVFAQNFITTVYGWHLHRLRYGGKFSAYCMRSRSQEWLPKGKLLEIQLQRLKYVLRYAYEQVPYYQTIFNECWVKPEGFQSPEDLKKLPILDKQFVRENPQQSIPKNFLIKRLYTGRISGTTCTPLIIYYNKDAFRRSFAFMEERCRKWAGVSIRSSRVMLGGRTVVPIEQNKPRFCRYNAVERQWSFSSYHLSEKNLPYCTEKLHDINIGYYIVGYPSSLYALAWYMHRHVLPPLRLVPATTNA